MATPGVPVDNNEDKKDQSEPAGEEDFETLKYQLLGPSLTKAGQDAVDQQKVSEIIYNASKGSKFFNHEQERDRNLTVKIERILKAKARLEKLDLSHDLRRADEYLAELELSRDLSQFVIHVDCDAFFAAVEELDRPELKTVPMAVGKGVLTTCNYLARKFGVRSGMASFVAKKLCPHLVLLPQNYEKYTAKATEIRAIMAEYDPLFETASVDEAYLNITAYCDENQVDPEEAVQNMRARILEETKVSVSAGIAANAKIAKIASNQNKPNGQFCVVNKREAIMEFMRTLPVRKVNGVGRVFERELGSIGVVTCGDIYPHRAMLTKLFGEKAFQFLAQCYLGLGRTNIQPIEASERKSVSTETTFNEIGDKEELRAKLRWAAEEMEKDLVRTQFKGRTLCLKVKLHTFEVLTRQTAPPRAVSQANDLYAFALPMLVKLEKEIPGMKLRLLGLRCSNLVSTKKAGINFFGVTTQPRSSAAQTTETSVQKDDHEIGPEEAFESSARQEVQDEMNDLEQLSQEAAHFPDTGESSGAVNPGSSPAQWECPICGRPQVADDRVFNDHVDFCLSRQTIREVVEDTSQEEPSAPASRKRKPSQPSTANNDTRQKRLFFQ
ncbi:Amino acid/polyamine transporter I [Penicillium atrosanguineum]|uniref:Amino acid/polyamine transporter I n=1 Tax=Penicillium atrosanguineum TaxID=1132637 RepID=UPI00238F3730|nr:Amino acid/polyamine transporter I [Penicillium atrosanguineum]KAJ5300352.1 Amino acid/polyamine transporter I [Penicillium atrosanguineum]